MRVMVFLPGLSAEAAVGAAVVEEIPRDLVHGIIVVDNGSIDRTAALVSAAGGRASSEGTFPTSNSRRRSTSGTGRNSAERHRPPAGGVRQGRGHGRALRTPRAPRS